MDLFRQEVIAAKRQGNLGGLRVNPPRVGWFLASVSLLTLSTIGCFLLFGTYTSFERLDGRLIPEGGPLRITTPRSLTITQLHTTVGTLVRKGDPLMVLTDRSESPALGSIQQYVSEQLATKRDAIVGSTNGNLIAENTKRSAIINQISLAHTELLELETQERIQASRAATIADTYEKWSTDARDVISAYQISQQRDQMLQSRARLSELRQQMIRVRQEIIRFEAEERVAQQEIEILNNGLEIQLADVGQVEAQIAASSEIVINAPLDGIVTSINAVPGVLVQQGSSLITLHPSGKPLVAELWAPSRSIGAVSKSIAAVIRYDAFPHQNYGTYSGTVLSADTSASSPEIVREALGEDVEEPRYRLLVELESQYVESGGQRESLKQGMTVSADIISGKSRIFDVLFKRPDSKGT